VGAERSEPSELQKRIDAAMGFQRSVFQTRDTVDLGAGGKHIDPGSFDADAAAVFRLGAGGLRAQAAAAQAAAAENAAAAQAETEAAELPSTFGAAELPSTFGRPLDLSPSGAAVPIVSHPRPGLVGHESLAINGGVALSRARPGGLAASLGGSQAIEAHSDLAALSRSTQAFAPRPGLSFNHGSVSSK
jgi:hypothetical protein